MEITQVRSELDPQPFHLDDRATQPPIDEACGEWIAHRLLVDRQLKLQAALLGPVSTNYAGYSQRVQVMSGG